MQTQRVNITLPRDIIRQLRTEVPVGKRSRFIAAAVSEKLTKKQSVEKALEKSLKANRKFDEAVMKDWAVTEVEGWSE
ncbi:MAG: hypothetical protein HY429_00730 [Candidatus Levybacteria bacterium]|nr:hypothetical protein [Candidatus Levybacteria bacterium]